MEDKEIWDWEAPEGCHIIKLLSKIRLWAPIDIEAEIKKHDTLVLSDGTEYRKIFEPTGDYQGDAHEV